MKQPAGKIIPLTQLGWSTPSAEFAPGEMSQRPACEPPKPAKFKATPDLGAVLYTLNCGQPGFRAPENGEFILGVYRDAHGAAYPILLWTDPSIDLFFDLSRRQHVKPPAFYIKLAEQPKIDALSGYPIIDEMVCPY